jgi:lipopolysaccharide biosynthesis protein
MPKIAVHLHIYYADMWELMKSYLGNLNLPYHLYVTLIDDNAQLQMQIKEFHPDTTFWIVPNRGYDVGPFIWFINHVNLDEYDLILKIHTKNRQLSTDVSLNGRRIDRKQWFDLLMTSLLGSKEIVEKNLQAFEKDKILGMIGSKYLITSDTKISKDLEKTIYTEMNTLGYDKPEKIEFVAGTMFFIRTKILKKIQNKYTLNTFNFTDGHIHDGTFAHVFERLFGCITCAEGYHIKGIDRNYHFEYEEKIKKFKRFAYSKRITSHNYLLIKVFKIPVYHKKII